MAGLSSRFQKAGYRLPKYMLPLAGHSMLQRVVSGFRSQFDEQEFLFICRDIADTEAFIHSEMQQMVPAPASYKIIVLEQETAGQADTVYQGLKRANVQPDEPLTIFNIDSQHRDFQYPEAFAHSDVDGYLEVFEEQGDHWSFALPDPNSDAPNVVREVAEKRRISDLCSTGLYYFRSAETFYDLFEATLSTAPEHLDGSERYIAPLYNIAIQRGLDIRYAKIARDAITITGTPDEYRDALEKFKVE